MKNFTDDFIRLEDALDRPVRKKSTRRDRNRLAELLSSIELEGLSRLDRLTIDDLDRLDCLSELEMR